MRFFLFIFLFILSLSFVFSATIEMDDEFYLGDNGIVKVSANFYEPIELSDIDFYRRHMITSFENIKTIKIGNEQFITFKVPLNKPSPDNYSINTTVKENFMEQIQENEVSSKFIVLNETGSFYVEKVFFVATENYSVPVQNLGGTEIKIDISSSSEEESSENFLSGLFGKSSSENEISLGPYEKKYIEFGIGNESKLVKIDLEKDNESQTVLVYENVLIDEDGEEFTPPEEEPQNNTGNESEGNVEEEVYIEEKNESVGFEEENNSENLNETETNKTEGNETEESSLKTCAEMAGKICNPENETCEGVVKDARNGVCCIGDCIEKETSPAGKWIGWALLAVVLFSVGYALWKNKGKKGKGLELSKEKK